MTNRISLKILLGFLLIINANLAFAIKEPKSLAVDKRLGVLVYSPLDVHKFTGYYTYQSSIIFSEDETIETISMGDSTAWQMVPNGNRLFLKPIDKDATTNMTLITNKRVYYFELHAENAKDINETGLMFAVKFLYHDEQPTSGHANMINTKVGPNLADRSLYNFDYTISGPDIISPIKIFDDGKFTYFQFKDNNAELPAVFYVTDRAKEGLINYRIVGEYLVVESIRDRFSLRYDKDVVCVFNEKMLKERKDADKSHGQSSSVKKH